MQSINSTDYTHTNLSDAFTSVRTDSEAICQPLEKEDYGIQTMPDVSPPKWHLAHTSWFFETFILKPYLKNYRSYDPLFAHLFNSYYEQAGTFHPRPERGLLSRPTVDEIIAYRQHINGYMQELLTDSQHPEYKEIQRRTEIGIHHEQQHQELLLTDIKHIFAYNPLKPVYKDLAKPATAEPAELSWHEQPAGIYAIGNKGDGFAYDNEFPRHKVYLEPFRIARRLVTNREYLQFIMQGGYDNPALWLSDGWKTIQENNWRTPLYWENIDDRWFEMTLAGIRPLDLTAPLSHVSFYEANAYANWKGLRLPTEMEWEVVASDLDIDGNLRDQGYLQPISSSESGLTQFYGDVWEWTQSSYTPYPGYRAAEGALGEYNGKFMSSQMVLRGGSCVTPKNHIRASYRNFFYPGDRWQFTGIRLAETI
ncbi:MAG: ergothioneine biosynthesis protein EgtB [Thioalkalispiraceae bacterium]|jgi:ergothioneine biosynthesis protein EgtB